MIIQVSKSFWRSLLNTANNANPNIKRSEINEQNIPNNIKKSLIYENIINDNDQIEWVIIKNKFQGVYLPNENITICYTQLLSSNGNSRARNTYIDQNLFYALLFSSKKNSKLYLCVNPYDINKPIPIAQYIQNTLKKASTAEIIIGKSFHYNGDKYNTIDQFIAESTALRDKNKGNISTLFDYDKDLNTLTIYGRLEGASGCGTLLDIKALAKMIEVKKAKKYFFDISKDRSIDKFKTLITNLGYLLCDPNKIENEIVNQIYHINRENKFNANIKEKQINEIFHRNQNLFKANILKKYSNIPEFNVNTCFACSYPIKNNLISSHIYRYIDIIHDYENGILNEKEATHLIVSGDNGFLLCPTQDKEFEKGMIVFDYRKRKFVANPNQLQENEISIVKANIHSANFNNVDFSDEFISNCKKHWTRTNYINN